MSKPFSTVLGVKQHLHLKGGQTVYVQPDTLSSRSEATEINAQLTHDGLDAYYLVYLGVDDSYSLTADANKMKVDSVCVLVIGCQSKEHEILVKEGDMFAIVATPGHTFHIKYESDNTANDKGQRLTVFPDNDVTLNPTNGRSYFIYALPDQDVDKVKSTIIRVRAVQ